MRTIFPNPHFVINHKNQLFYNTKSHLNPIFSSQARFFEFTNESTRKTYFNENIGIFILRLSSQSTSIISWTEPYSLQTTYTAIGLRQAWIEQSLIKNLFLVQKNCDFWLKQFLLFYVINNSLFILYHKHTISYFIQKLFVTLLIKMITENWK